MSYMKRKYNQHQKRLLEQKAVQDKFSKPNKSPIQVQEFLDQGKNLKVASTNPVKHLAPETSSGCIQNSGDNISSSSEDMLDSELFSVQTDVQDLYTCQTCQKTFTKKSSLSNHMRLHNSEEITHPCDFCGKQFAKLSSMQHHRRLHTGETPYLCKVCEKWFRTPAALSRHKRVHTGDKIQTCEYCNKQFLYNYAYLTHIRIHTGEKPYECDVCKKQFSQTSALNRHMLIHKAITPYSCELCPRKFRQRSEVTVHMRNHTGERPYSCETCNKCFIQKCNLISHIKTYIKKGRMCKPVTSKEPCKLEVVLVKEEREKLCEEPEWVETLEDPVCVKKQKWERRASSERPQDFFVEVPVIKEESFEDLLDATNSES